MKDGSDAVSDWPLLNALLNCASGATWVSLHHGGGVGMGFSQHAGMVIVCDGTPEAASRIGRVLWNDPATGVMRHADAGYDLAIDCARVTSSTSVPALRKDAAIEDHPRRKLPHHAMEEGGGSTTEIVADHPAPRSTTSTGASVWQGSPPTAPFPNFPESTARLPSLTGRA